MLQCNARAARDAIVWIGCELRNNARATVHELRHLAELRGAAGEDDAVVDDVGRKLGRRVLEHFAYRLRHLAQFARHRLHDVIRRNLDRTRQTAHHITPLHLHRQLFAHRHRRTDAYLDFFSSLIADREIMMLLHMVDYGAIKAIASTLYRGRGDDAAERYDGNVDGAASNVRNHAPHRFVDGDARADSG